MTLHLNCRYGKNDHHKVEGLFKAFARALRTAVRIDPDRADQIPSTKGVL
jgi:imidazoleglycerol-phosphate dehydratase